MLQNLLHLKTESFAVVYCLLIITFTDLGGKKKETTNNKKRSCGVNSESGKLSPCLPFICLFTYQYLSVTLLKYMLSLTKAAHLVEDVPAHSRGTGIG